MSTFGLRAWGASDELRLYACLSAISKAKLSACMRFITFKPNGLRGQLAISQWSSWCRVYGFTCLLNWHSWSYFDLLHVKVTWEIPMSQSTKFRSVQHLGSRDKLRYNICFCHALVD